MCFFKKEKKISKNLFKPMFLIMYPKCCQLPNRNVRIRVHACLLAQCGQKAQGNTDDSKDTQNLFSTPAIGLSFINMNLPLKHFQYFKGLLHFQI